MANLIKLKRGLDIKLKGQAAQTLAESAPSGLVALNPDDFYGVSPKLAVREGDAVKVGTPVFFDKNHPEVKIVSPVSGTVKAVNRGERRKIVSVEIENDGKMSQEDFSGTDTSNTLDALLRSGLFAFVKQRPYDIVANPEVAPKAIFVSAFDSAPLAPDFDFVIEKSDFQNGINALAAVAKVFVGVRPNSKFADVQNAEVTAFDGPHPAGNVGVQINNVAPINKGETVWTVNAADVAVMGKFFAGKTLDFSRVIALAGSEVENPRYVKTVLGASLASILGGNNEKAERHLRYINGNPLSGKLTSAGGYLSAVAHQITVIPEGDDVDEMLGWIAPRFSQFSTSRSYFSWIRDLFCKQGYALDARVKGGERHMIMSGEYDKVFPMDIYPEYLIKAIIAGDIDKMEALGIYEVAPEDFALCEFVDSSKLELQHIVRSGLDMLREEMA